MSDEQQHEIEKYIGTLKWVVTLGWALIAGAFGLGIWVTNIQSNQNILFESVKAHTSDIKNHGVELNLVHVRQAVSATDLTYIRSVLERIEKKLP